MANETVQNLKVRVEITGKVTGSDGSQQLVNVVKEVYFTDGTSTDQVGQVWWDASRALNTTNEDLDVAGSTITDWKTGALDMTKVRLVFIENLDTDTGDKLTVTQPASNGVPNIFAAASDGVIVHPGGFFLWCAPGADAANVTASTGDLINVAAADNSTYQALIAGPNA